MRLSFLKACENVYRAVFPVFSKGLSTTNGPLSINETNKRRLLYRAVNRGTIENGTILGDFVRVNIDGMSHEDLSEFETILDMDDVDLFRWLSSEDSPPVSIEKLEVFKRLRAFTNAFSLQRE
jgi:antitoxin CptB